MLLLAMISSLLVDSEPARARTWELSRRLGVARDAPARGGMRQRLRWVLRDHPRALRRVAAAVFANSPNEAFFDPNNRSGFAIRAMADREIPEQVRPDYRDMRLEPLVPWFAREVDRGLSIADVDWGAALRRDVGGHPGRQVSLEMARELGEWLRLGTERAVIPTSASEWLNIPPPTGADWGPDTSLAVKVNAEDDPQLSHQPLPRVTSVRVSLPPHGPHDYVVVATFTGVLLTLLQIADWAAATHPDLTQLTFGEACRAQQDWHERLLALQRSGPVSGRAVEVARWRDDAVIVRLLDGTALEDEGRRMGHCVGTYSQDVASGRSAIFSYRNAEGVSLATIELIRNSRADPPTWRITQLNGPGNRAVRDPLIPVRATALEHVMNGGTSSEMNRAAEAWTAALQVTPEWRDPVPDLVRQYLDAEAEAPRDPRSAKRRYHQLWRDIRQAGREATARAAETVAARLGARVTESDGSATSKDVAVRQIDAAGMLLTLVVFCDPLLERSEDLDGTHLQWSASAKINKLLLVPADSQEYTPSGPYAAMRLAVGMSPESGAPVDDRTLLVAIGRAMTGVRVDALEATR